LNVATKHTLNRYQQTRFDISEIYARQFRKMLWEYPSSINKKVAKTIYEKMSADYNIRCLQYIVATDYGRNDEQQAIWERQINHELTELADFDYYK
jgi:hypothetical protein